LDWRSEANWVNHSILNWNQKLNSLGRVFFEVKLFVPPSLRAEPVSGTHNLHLRSSWQVRTSIKDYLSCFSVGGSQCVYSPGTSFQRIRIFAIYLINKINNSGARGPSVLGVRLLAWCTREFALDLF
jgi:hypothetical protein